MKDFWGNEIVEMEKKRNNSPYKIVKSVNNYRKTKSKIFRCKNCALLLTIDHHDRRYFKCKLIGSSASEATDIRIGYVCEKFAHVGDKKEAK